MKQEINLLPISLQKKRLRHLYLARLGRLLSRIYLLLLMVIVAQLGILAAYHSIARDMDYQGSAQQSIRDVLGETQQLNETLLAFDERVRDQVSWIVLIEDILEVVKRPVLITGMGVDGEGQTVTIDGTSTSRAAVASQQTRFGRLPWVKSVDAPLSNYSVDEDLEFSLILQISK